MIDKQTQQFFDHWNEHCMADFLFMRSQAGIEWFRELRCLAADITVDEYRKYAEWLAEEMQKAVDNDDAHRTTMLAMNAFDNQMRFIWA